jgi:hypothetical protein
MRRYILDAPLTPPKDTSDAAERLITLAKTCREIIADGTVTADEAGALKRWLQAAGWLKKFWPANAIAERINRMLEPFPTQKELTELREFLRQVVDGTSFVDCDEPVGLFDEPVPKTIFAERTFCLTGIFYYGYRGDCEDATHRFAIRFLRPNPVHQFIPLVCDAATTLKYSLQLQPWGAFAEALASELVNTFTELARPVVSRSVQRFIRAFTSFITV